MSLRKMATESLVDAAKTPGPSGFIEINQNLLVVDHGKIFLDGSPVGFLFEDGLIQGTAAPFDGFQGLKIIEDIPGCVFRGIDSNGVVLELPSPARGPLGGLKYNGVQLTVLHGRIATLDHKVLGTFDDNGVIHLRDRKTPSVLHQMDDGCQLSTVFQGIKSDGSTPLLLEWNRPLHRKDKTFMDNEIIRYFEDFDKLNQVQKQYVLDTMRLWGASGILSIVRKSEGDAALGNVKHGASGVTGVRTGKVTLDREEFEIEIKLYKQCGPIAKLPARVRPYNEVRINLVVSHEFGHQLEFTLSHAYQDKIQDIYNERLTKCNRTHPLPEGYEGGSELLLPDQIERRIFISGYCRSSWHEYWAEAVAAFSVKESRQVLKHMDPAVYNILRDVIYSPETTLSPMHEKDSVKLQTSLRVGGELNDDLLDT